MNKVELVFLSGPMVGRKFEVGNEISIGRSDANAICLDDPQVSSRHCLIYLKNGCPFVKDLDSTNGTKLNDEPVAEHEITDKDTIIVGGNEILVRVKKTAPAAVPEIGKTAPTVIVEPVVGGSQRSEIRDQPPSLGSYGVPRRSEVSQAPAEAEAVTPAALVLPVKEEAPAEVAVEPEPMPVVEEAAPAVAVEAEAVREEAAVVPEEPVVAAVAEAPVVPATAGEQTESGTEPGTAAEVVLDQPVVAYDVDTRPAEASVGATVVEAIARVRRSIDVSPKGWRRTWRRRPQEERTTAAAELATLFVRSKMETLLPVVMIVSLFVHGVTLPFLVLGKGGISRKELMDKENKYLNQVLQKERGKVVADDMSKKNLNAPPPPDPEKFVSEQLAEVLKEDVKKVTAGLMDVRLEKDLSERIETSMAEELKAASVKIAKGEVSKEEMKRLQREFKEKAYAKTKEWRAEYREKEQLNISQQSVMDWYEKKVAPQFKSVIRDRFFLKGGIWQSTYGASCVGFIMVFEREYRRLLGQKTSYPDSRVWQDYWPYREYEWLVRMAGSFRDDGTLGWQYVMVNQGLPENVEFVYEHGTPKLPDWPQASEKQACANFRGTE